jgi:hypothetical protein
MHLEDDGEHQVTSLASPAGWLATAPQRNRSRCRVRVRRHVFFQRTGELTSGTIDFIDRHADPADPATGAAALALSAGFAKRLKVSSRFAVVQQQHQAQPKNLNKQPHYQQQRISSVMAAAEPSRWYTGKNQAFPNFPKMRVYLPQGGHWRQKGGWGVGLLPRRGGRAEPENVNALMAGTAALKRKRVGRPLRLER